MARCDASVADLDRQRHACFTDAPGGDDAHRPCAIVRCGRRSDAGCDDCERDECAGDGAALDELQQDGSPLLLRNCEVPFVGKSVSTIWFPCPAKNSSSRTENCAPFRRQMRRLEGAGAIIERPMSHAWHLANVDC